MVTGDRTWVSLGRAVPGLQPALDAWVRDDRLQEAPNGPICYSKRLLTTNLHRLHQTPVDANGLMTNHQGQLVTFTTHRSPGWTIGRIVWDWTQVTCLER